MIERFNGEEGRGAFKSIGAYGNVLARHDQKGLQVDVETRAGTGQSIVAPC